MKRSEAQLEITYILDRNIEDFSNPSLAELILTKLEELNLIDSSQYGSVCSRCKRKSWDEE